MNVYLVHHADAVWPAVDPQRPLSAKGVAQAERLAAKASAAGVAPAAIWHSGKLRSRQTAEPFLRLCNPFADFTMVRGLNPDDAPAIMRDVLLRETRDVLLVGHRPHIFALAHVLTGDQRGVPLHGLVALEFRAETLEWVERWRAAGEEGEL